MKHEDIMRSLLNNKQAYDAAMKSIKLHQKEKENEGCVTTAWVISSIVIGAFLLSIIWSPSIPSGHKKTDGVYESAVEKINKGLPVNEREARRLHDILNYDQKKQIEEIERRNGQGY